MKVQQQQQQQQQLLLHNIAKRSNRIEPAEQKYI